MKIILAACLILGSAAAAQTVDRAPRAGGAVAPAAVAASTSDYRNPKAGGDASDIVSQLCNRQGCRGLSASESEMVFELAGR